MANKYKVSVKVNEQIKTGTVTSNNSINALRAVLKNGFNGKQFTVTPIETKRGANAIVEQVVANGEKPNIHYYKYTVTKAEQTAKRTTSPAKPNAFTGLFELNIPYKIPTYLRGETKAQIAKYAADTLREDISGELGIHVIGEPKVKSVFEADYGIFVTIRITFVFCDDEWEEITNADEIKEHCSDFVERTNYYDFTWVEPDWGQLIVTALLLTLHETASRKLILSRK